MNREYTDTVMKPNNKLRRYIKGLQNILVPQNIQLWWNFMKNATEVSILNEEARSNYS